MPFVDGTQLFKDAERLIVSLRAERDLLVQERDSLRAERDDLRTQLLDITMRAHGVVSRREHDDALASIHDLLSVIEARREIWNGIAIIGLMVRRARKILEIANA